METRKLLATSVIDLAVVYTDGAVTTVGSDALLRTRVQQSIDATNFAMNNSRIDVVIRLVRIEPITYAGSNDLYVDRTRLENVSDGFMDGAAATRNTYGADLVMLVVENSHGGGNANLMTDINSPSNNKLAFSAIAANSLGANNFTVAHELGHTLGAGHERGNTIDPAVGPFTYSYGYRFTAAGRTYHDLMSYDPGIEVAYYANPAVSYLGSPLGASIASANEADLASTFAQTAPVVASYRSTVVADVTAPLAQFDSVKIKNGFAYVSVLYLDDGGIDITSIGTGDITLSAPGLPTLTPALDAIENPAVGGGLKRATYRAYLRDYPIAPDSITLTLGVSQVRNLSGAFAAAGTVAASTTHTAGWSYSESRDLGALDGALLINGRLTSGDSDQVYRFTLASAQTVTFALTHLVADANIFVVRDANNDGLYQSSEIIEGSYRTGNADESFAFNLAAGEYFAWVYQPVETPYSISIRGYTDSMAPTAMLDAKDISAATNEFLFNVVYHDNQEINAYLARYYSPVRLTNPFGGYYVYFAEAIDVDVNGPTRSVTYRINAGFTLSSSDNGLYTVALEPGNSTIFNPALARYVGDGAGNPVPTTGTLGAFRVAIGQADVAAPTAVGLNAETIQRGGAATYEFDVTYADNRTLDAASLATGKVRVTGPAGYSVLADPISVSAAPTVGSRRTVRYRATSPGGVWDFKNRGTYTVSTVANQIKDSSNNFTAVASIGTFVANIPIPGDADRNGRVEFDDLLLVAQNYGQTGKTFAQGNFNDDEAGNIGFDDLLLLAQNYGLTNLEGFDCRKAPTAFRKYRFCLSL